MQYFGMLLLGVLLFLIADIIRWNKATPNIAPAETAKEYFRLNWLAVAGDIILALVILILAIKGEFDLFELLNIPPTLSLTSSLLIGVGCSALFKIFMGIVPAMRTSGDSIDTPPK